jgi:hypothetical protein
MDSIIITTNLLGEIGGCVAHTTRQKHSVILSEEFGNSVSRIIKHTDRKESESVRLASVPGEVVDTWVKGECPYWENPKEWKKLTVLQRVISHVSRFDEGHGVGFEFVGDSDHDE